LSPQTVSTKLARIAQESGRKDLRLDGQQQSCRLVVWLAARLLDPLGPVLTNRMTELVTYGSVGGGGSDPASYPARSPSMKPPLLSGIDRRGVVDPTSSAAHPIGRR